MTKRFRDLFNEDTGHLTEELHSALRQWLGNHEDNVSATQRHNMVTANIRSLAKRGEDTGLEDGKPKKGSSRAVYFPKDGHKMVLDGHQTEMPTALKIAFPGHLDKYREPGERLLGEHQNEIENDHFTRNHFGMLRQTTQGHYQTNEHGVFVPVVDNHEEHHWSLHGRVGKLGSGDFNRLTKTEGYPKGISHKDFYDAVNLHHSEAHGTKTYEGSDEAKARVAHLRHVQSHPFVENVTDAMFTTGMHPGDLTKANMGVWKHPVTGKEHLVISDYGFGGDVPKEYQKRRTREARAKDPLRGMFRR